MKINCSLDAVSTMYPAKSEIISLALDSTVQPCIGSSIYGYVVSGKIEFHVDGNEDSYATAGEGSVFSVAHGTLLRSSRANTCIWIITRFGFTVPFNITKPEYRGRLSYIDGCSDSLLIYPPRKGDGSMSLLYFPPGIEQTWHTHPSIRLGLVIGGDGVAEWRDHSGHLQTHELKPGDCFMLSEHEQHRFSTSSGSELRILAYHPDGDWGPEDHNHTMLNRTYIASAQHRSPGT